MPPKSKRLPGLLLPLRKKVPSKAPAWVKAMMRELDQQLSKIWMAIQNTLPGEHGPTHLGASDNIVSRDVPSEILVGVPGNAGDPAGGVAAGNHVHSTENLFPEGGLDPGSVGGNPKAPFRTLREQLGWLNSRAAEYSYNYVKAGMFR